MLKEAEELGTRPCLAHGYGLSNSHHEEIGLIVKLATGETVEVVSTMIDYESDLVEIKGGHAIPLRAIVRVEL